MPIDEKKLVELKAAHPHAVHLKHGDDHAIFKLPSRADRRKWLSDRDDPQLKHQALENLVVSCCLYPDRPDFTAMLDRRGMLVDGFGDKLLKLAGFTDAEEVKKS